MAHIDYFLSVLSPWAYFAADRLERIAERRGATISYKPLDALAVFAATGGLPPAQRPPARMAYRLQELRRASAKTGMPYHEQPAHWPTDPLPASRAVIALADAGGDAGALARSIMSAVWVEQEDIADQSIVETKLRAIGVDPTSLDLAAADAAYLANTEEAVSRGVFGVPFYIVGEEMFWGQDKLDDLDRYLGQA
ncbi:MAG: 2-hydroxychromene-2-carboxylate isomerase [Pseudomonadota bacterium]